LLVGVVSLVFWMGSDYETYIETTEAQIQSLQSQMNQVSESLESTQLQLAEEKQNSSLLSRQVSRLSTEGSGLRLELKDVKNETLGLLDTIEEYQKEIESSMEWFKQNSELGETQMEETVKARIESACMNMKRDECQIKTGCFYLLNEERWDITYKSDAQTSGRADKMMSLTEFLDNSGGDCEDYSMFYKAEFNHLLEECEKNNAKTISIEAWYRAGASGGIHWLSYEKKWYFEFVNGIFLEPDYIYPHVVCGYIFDLRTQQLGGHCILAFTKNKIESVEDIEKELRLAPVIEPQNGKYLGLIEDTTSGIYLNQGQGSYITTVISDNDYFMSTDNGWTGYSLFNKQLEEKENSVRAMI